MEQYAIDRTKLPSKIEESEGFQRWITNWKKRMDVAADGFVYREKNEVFNSTFLTVTKVESDDEVQKIADAVDSYRQFNDVTFSPSNRQFLDYRHVERGDYDTNQVHYYGLRDDRLIDTRILECVKMANCYFDRAYFIDNHTFVISEISRNVHKDDIETVPSCTANELCTYTFKLHFIDLINSERLVYESAPFDVILSEIVQYF